MTNRPHSRKREIVTHRKWECFHLWILGFKQSEIGQMLGLSQTGVSYLIKTYSR